MLSNTDTWPYEHRTLRDGSGEVLVSSYIYSGLLDKDTRIHIVIKEGFTWDGASIPRLMWKLIGSPLRGRYQRACLIHDWLYRKQTLFINDEFIICDRLLADKILLAIMKEDKVSWWRQKTLYYGVRLGGRKVWNEVEVIKV